MPTAIALVHRNVRSRDRRRLVWYSTLEAELQSLICLPGNGVTCRCNKGSTCFVGRDARPVFELVCVGTDADKIVFGINKNAADAVPALAALPWTRTFNVMPANPGDATFYEIQLSTDAPARCRRIEKLVQKLRLEGDGRDELSEAIDAL
ncbi:MAG: hypothetical protein EXS16_08470 [Gemmataceae bacterium]|nr:hypothetical protein [Gemmataceae bacterium]